MTRDEVTRKFIVEPITDDELYFIMRHERLKVFHVKSVSFARVRAFHVDNLDHTLGDSRERPFAAGLEQYSEAAIQQALHQRYQFALLQHGLASGEFDQPPIWAQALHLVEHFC